MQNVAPFQVWAKPKQNMTLVLRQSEIVYCSQRARAMPSQAKPTQRNTTDSAALCLQFGAKQSTKPPQHKTTTRRRCALASEQIMLVSIGLLAELYNGQPSNEVPSSH